jgi:hypothetical protein
MHPDPDGSECRNLAAARLHAERVATELMRNADQERKLWSLRVEDGEGRHVFDVLFADVWQNIGGPSPELLSRARKTSLHLAVLVDAAHVLRRTGMSRSRHVWPGIISEFLGAFFTSLRFARQRTSPSYQHTPECGTGQSCSPTASASP